jgi:hypothetical protein
MPDYVSVLKRWIERNCDVQQKAAMRDALIEAEANKEPGTVIPYDEAGVILMRAGYGLSEGEARRMVDEIFANPTVMPRDVLELLD